MIVRRIRSSIMILLSVLTAGVVLAGCDQGPVVLSGTVTVTSGAPASNILVSVYDSAGTTLVTSVRTASDGTYSVHSVPLPDGTYKVLFGQPGYDQWWQNASSAATATPVAIDDAAPTVISPVLAEGRIHGAVTGGAAPIEGATVEAIEGDVTNADNVVATTTTDYDGNYSFDHLPIGVYRVRVSDAGAATRYVDHTGAGTTQPGPAESPDVEAGADVAMTTLNTIPESTLTGKVTGLGSPLTGIQVTALDATSGLGVSTTATVAPDGSFEVKGLSNTSYNLTLTDPAGNFAAEVNGPFTPPSMGNLDVGVLAMAGSDCNPSFTGADLTGIDLSGKNLAGCDLTSTNLTNANLTGANLTQAKFVSQLFSASNLTGANLTNANVTGATLDATILNGANIQGADFTGATFNAVRSNAGGVAGSPVALPSDWTVMGGFIFGPTADLAYANLTGFDLTGVNISNADLQHADLTTAQFSGVDLHTIGTGLEYANLGGAQMDFANFSGVSFRYADLTQADMTGADLSYADFIFTTLLDTDLSGANLYRLRSRDVVGTPIGLPSTFELRGGYIYGPNVDIDDWFLNGLDLTGLDLTGASAKNTMFDASNLTGTVLSGADLSSADLHDVNLSSVALDGADLTSADLEGANISNTYFTGASLTSIHSGGLTAPDGPPALPAGWVLADGYLIGPGANLAGASIMDETLPNLDLTGANLTGATIHNSHLVGANFTNANLTDADLSNSWFDSAIFTGADVSRANLAWEYFTGYQSGGLTAPGGPPTLGLGYKLINGYIIGHGADLTGALLKYADLHGMYLEDVNFTNATLTYANLQNAALANSNLEGVDLANAQLAGVTSAGLTGTPYALPPGWSLVAGELVYNPL